MINHTKNSEHSNYARIMKKRPNCVSHVLKGSVQIVRGV